MKFDKLAWCLMLLFVASTCYAQVSREDFPVEGTYPAALAFDGTHIWISHGGGVTEMRASDGTILRRFDDLSGAGALLFDGANLWVTAFGMNTDAGVLVKLRASDGVTLGKFQLGIWPGYLAFDGTNIWVTNPSGNSVLRVRASDGAILDTYPVGSFPLGVGFDGTNVWVGNVLDSSVTKLKASDGSNLGTFAVAASGSPNDIAYDGHDIWVTNSPLVTKLNVNDGSILKALSNGVDQPCGGANGLAFDGANMWVSNLCNDTVTRFRAKDGSNLGTYAVGSYPMDVVSDGKSIWTANWGDGTVTRLKVTDEAFVEPPVEADGSSVFSAARGVIPLKFTLAENGVPTCVMPPATISISRIGDGVVGLVSPSIFETSADTGSTFRVDQSGCQYLYNVASASLARSMGRGKYRVDISINNFVVGAAVFTLQ